jgi:hypothetical protein
MSDPDVKYDRLPGIGRGIATVVSLWQGPDHLLQVRASSLGERYSRFYYRDIQAIFVRPTAEALATRAAFGALALASLMLGFVASTEVAIFAWVAAALLGFVVLVDFLRGPSCQCFITTPAQTERLASLVRLRMARKVFDQIRPLIENAQSTR